MRKLALSIAQSGFDAGDALAGFDGGGTGDGTQDGLAAGAHAGIRLGGHERRSRAVLMLWILAASVTGKVKPDVVIRGKLGVLGYGV